MKKYDKEYKLRTVGYSESHSKEQHLLPEVVLFVFCGEYPILTPYKIMYLGYDIRSNICRNIIV